MGRPSSHHFVSEIKDPGLLRWFYLNTIYYVHAFVGHLFAEATATIRTGRHAVVGLPLVGRFRHNRQCVHELVAQLVFDQCVDHAMPLEQRLVAELLGDDQHLEVAL